MSTLHSTLLNFLRNGPYKIDICIKNFTVLFLLFTVRQNNWPPLPNFCPIQPCFYQDINVDIPVEFQKIVKYLYYLWIGHVSLLLANFIIGFLYLCVNGDQGATMGLALVYFFLFTPASFVCWFRPAYKAFR